MYRVKGLAGTRVCVVNIVKKAGDGRAVRPCKVTLYVQGKFLAHSVGTSLSAPGLPPVPNPFRTRVSPRNYMMVSTSLKH
jgi:hypothetical protein